MSCDTNSRYMDNSMYHDSVLFSQSRYTAKYKSEVYRFSDVPQFCSNDKIKVYCMFQFRGISKFTYTSTLYVIKIRSTMLNTKLRYIANYIYLKIGCRTNSSYNLIRKLEVYPQRHIPRNCMGK